MAEISRLPEGALGGPVPAGAIDCHMHIYDGSVPFHANAGLPHPDATIADYAIVQQSLGLSRAVVVAPSAYGADNRVTMGAVAAMGRNARAVVIVGREVTDRELDALESAGACGARFNFNLTPGPSVDDLLALAPRLAERGWLIQIGMRSARLIAEAPQLRRLPGTLVLEHCAGIPASARFAEDPAYPFVMDLLESGRGWVKLSGPYLREPDGGPGYPMLRPFVRHLVARASERLVWGSDWPHPTLARKPEARGLLGLMWDWAPDEGARTRILVTNPARLFGFSETSAH